MKPQHLAFAVFLFAAPAWADVTAGPKLDPVFDADPFSTEVLATKPQTAPGLHAYLLGAEAASRLDNAVAEKNLRVAWTTPGASRDVGRHAMSLAATVLLHAGRYREAGDLLDQAISNYADDLTPDIRQDMDQARGVAMALRDQKPQTVAKSGNGRVPLSIDMLGLTRAPVVIEGHAEQAVLDTGANFSTLSATAAKQLGVKMLARKTSVASSTTEAVDTTLAIAHTLRLGPVTLHDVAFLVVNDAALSPLGPKSRIDVIVGFPVLAALGRITFREVPTGKPGKARELLMAASPRTTAAGNLRFDGFNAFIQARTNGEMVPFFVDSGADKTVFEKRYARTQPDKLKGLAHKTVRIGGAGLTEEREIAVVPAMTFVIGNAAVPLTDVPIELTGGGSDVNYGTIGNDVLWAKGGYTIDFGKLMLTLGSK
jgi:predicted aspartyl protease